MLGSEPESFSTYLVRKARISSRYGPYYLRWVEIYNKSNASDHSDVQTTMICTHVARKNKTVVISPLEKLLQPTESQ